VDDATQRPDVTLGIVRALGPNLGGHVVRRTNLRSGQSRFHKFGTPQVTDSHVLLGCEKDVAWLEVLQSQTGTSQNQTDSKSRDRHLSTHPVQNVLAVQVLQPHANLHQVAPNCVFRDVCILPLCFLDSAIDVTPFSELHDDEESITLNERFAVADDVLMLNGCQDANLVDGVFSVTATHTAVRCCLCPHAAMIHTVHGWTGCECSPP